MENQDLIMDYISLAPSLACNLRCRLCSVRSPYYSQIVPTSIECIKKIIDKYFEAVSSVKKVAIAGGEPLFYPHIDLIIEYLNKYNNRIGLLEIVTNGTIVPKKSVISAIKRYEGKTRFLIDNYGINLSTKVNEIDQILKKEDINNEIRNYTGENPYCGGWVDYAVTKTPKHTDDEAKKLYYKCAVPQKIKCFSIVNGVMYPCSPVRLCKEMGCEDNSTEYIDLLDNKTTTDEIRKKIIDISKKRL